MHSTAIPLFPLWAVRPVQTLSACTVQLYLYSPYVPYGLYRPSVPVQYSYTSTPPIGRTACTDPQCLYSTAIPVLPLLAVRPVESLSACVRVHFTFFFITLFCQLHSTRYNRTDSSHRATTAASYSYELAENTISSLLSRQLTSTPCLSS